jgi:molybdopterin-guanine dinucleotide biosynthesis protein A
VTLPYAVIIAGGKGARLGGVRKGELRIGGKRLVDRVVDSLGQIAGPLMIATGPQGGQAAIPDGAEAVADLAAPIGGPLAGLAAAVAALQRRGINEGLVVSVAVDTPFLPADYVFQLREALGDSASAYACWQDQFYPPNAIWQIGALANLPHLVQTEAAPRSLKALHQALGGRAIGWNGRNPFANLNTIADLLALERRAKNDP